MNNNDNQNHIKKTYSEKAMNLLRTCIGLMVLSLLTYFFALLYDSFDFGLIFELIAFIFMILAYSKIKGNNIQSCKRNIVISMIPIGWLIIYDLINLIVNIGEVLSVVAEYFLSIDQFFYSLSPYLYDVFLVAIIILLKKAFSSLNRADNSETAETYADHFYDKL